MLDLAGPALQRGGQCHTDLGFNVLLLPVDAQAEVQDGPVEQQPVDRELHQRGEEGGQAWRPGCGEEMGQAASRRLNAANTELPASV